MLFTLFVLLSVALLSLVLTGLFRWYAFSNRVIDSPNERSSHFRDTPTGGGVSITLAFLAGLVALWWHGDVTHQDVFVMVIAGGVISLVGFWDDHTPVSPLLRLLVQILCALWVLAWHDVFPAGDGWLWSVIQVLSLLGMVWFINLYNFMDGIDGLASIEAICACVGWVAIAYLTSVVTSVGDILYPLLLAAAVLGFLFWNFPPARIFMGDSGSLFIGLTLGTIAVMSSAGDLNRICIWLILLGVFVVDASFTLFRRVARAENPLTPHRTHAYQRAAKNFGSHKLVTLSVVLINLVWLFPLAYLVAKGYLQGLAGVVIAYALLLGLVISLGAGAKTVETD